MRLVTIVVLCILAAQEAAAERPLKLGIEFGYAHQQEMFNSGPSSGVQLAIAHFQFIPTLWERPGRPLRSVELVNELNFMQSIKPGSRFIIGVAEIFRFNFPVSPHWTLYTDAGVGISSSSLRVRENSGRMQYLLQAGGGAKRCRSGTRTCWLTEYRLVHLSNNYTTLPNFGLNLHAGFAGLNF